MFSKHLSQFHPFLCTPPEPGFIQYLCLHTFRCFTYTHVFKRNEDLRFNEYGVSVLKGEILLNSKEDKNTHTNVTIIKWKNGIMSLTRRK